MVLERHSEKKTCSDLYLSLCGAYIMMENLNLKAGNPSSTFIVVCVNCVSVQLLRLT